jgi:hypothetical protein
VGNPPSDVGTVTVERIERAIKTTARVMARHNLPQLMPTLQRLEAERDRLIRDGDPIEYAKRLLGSTRLSAAGHCSASSGTREQ